MLRSGKPPALLCHGPATAFAARDEDGSWPFTGYRLTGLSNLEEKFNSFGRKAVWLLEDRLRESGAKYSKSRLPMRAYVVVDRNLYTGQNPPSSTPLAERLLADVGAAETRWRLSGSPAMPAAARPRRVACAQQEGIMD